MTDATIKHESTEAADVYYDDAHDAHGEHPTEAAYWKIFAILAVLTAVEVLWSYLGLTGAALALPLLAMMTVKFILVCAFFMHLKYDMTILNGRTFTVLFGFGLVLAMIVYFVMFRTFATR